MSEVFVGSDALASGGLTRARLRWNYRAIFPDIYLTKQIVPSLAQRTVGAWLWSGRNAVIAGRAAAAMHGALWIRPDTPIEMIWRCGRPPPGILVRVSASTRWMWSLSPVCRSPVRNARPSTLRATFRETSR
jgi:alkylation response protein AidB-like acyl-CoA dehydrogenase